MTKVIVLDAGHGRNTPGKRTPDGEREWTFNDKMLRAAQKHLTDNYQGFTIVRTDDPTGNTDVSLAARATRANNAKGDVFVSFHNNAFQGKWGSHGGTETYVPTPAANNPRSSALARSVHPKMQRAFGLRDRGIKAGNLYVIMNTKMPAILVEGAFMDSTTDIVKLRDDNVLRRAGEAIAEGVAEFLALSKKPQPVAPKPVAPTVRPTTNPEAAKVDVYRVRVDGTQVGAYGNPKNALDEVEKALKAGKKKVELERV
ncbi:putative N-acetylmuramoyl-L-alanine amidase [Exiguobacterium phage vB_EauS-123]|nr:putative N-acetylmuramoyl-L-alanine amidase [Exiguobacterium phage vB_EauS-123]